MYCLDSNLRKWSRITYLQFSSVQSLSRVWLFVTPWITARQASLSITNSQSSLKLTSIKSVMPSSHLILGHPLFLLPPIPPSIRIFSNESTLLMRQPKYWSFSFSIIASKEHPVPGSSPSGSRVIRRWGWSRRLWKNTYLITDIERLEMDSVVGRLVEKKRLNNLDNVE